MKYHVLFNPLAGTHNEVQLKEELSKYYPDDILEFVDLTSISNMEAFFDSIGSDDQIILCGGDGTINRFVNDSALYLGNHKVLNYATGTGNDFLMDIGGKAGEKPIDITKYIVDLPLVTVGGKRMFFLNNVGFGIDGYCCEVGDEMREKKDGPINYGSIAVKGLLFHFKPVNAVVNVDGQEYRFENVWLAPTMNGRYYGGGMMAAPDQDRLNMEHTVSLMIYYCKSRIKTLISFPSIFSGEHVQHKDIVKIFTGHNIKVEFDRPTAIQVDGETVKGMTSYEVRSKQLSK